MVPLGICSGMEVWAPGGGDGGGSGEDDGGASALIC